MELKVYKTCVGSMDYGMGGRVVLHHTRCFPGVEIHGNFAGGVEGDWTRHLSKIESIAHTNPVPFADW